MGAGHKQVIWLTPQDPNEGDDALLMSVLCGDELRAPRGAWLRPAGVSRGEGIMLFGYNGAGGAFAFCTVAPPEVSPAWVESVRAELSLEGAERRWGPFVGQFGRYRSASFQAGPEAWLDTPIAHDGVIWRARRARHPSAAIDCLSRRDRTDAELRLREALVRMGPAQRDSAAVTPRGAPS